MPGLVRADHLPAFDTIKTEESDFRCIYALEKKRFRRCANRVNERDRLDAASRKQAILDCHNYTGRKTLLVEYAKLCCCVLNHRPALVSNTVLVGEICRIWANEIDLSNNSNISVPPTPLISPNIIIRNQPRSNHNFSDLSSRDPTFIFNSQNNVDERTKRRILRSARKESLIGNPDPLLPHFAPYLTKPDLSLAEAIRRPLLRSERTEGTIYLFTRPAAPGLVKIGYTAKQPDERLRSWQAKCQYVPRLEFATSRVPNAKRVEFLVQNELWKERRRQQDCVCGTRHIEWFEIDILRASAVIKRWALWMQDHCPYDEAGKLKTQWKEKIDGLNQRRVTTTGEVILKALTTDSTKDEHQSSRQVALDNEMHREKKRTEWERKEQEERRILAELDKGRTMRQQFQPEQSTPMPLPSKASTSISRSIAPISSPIPRAATAPQDLAPITLDSRAAELLETLTKALLDLHTLINAEKDRETNRSVDLATKRTPVVQSTFMALQSHDIRS